MLAPRTIARVLLLAGILLAASPLARAEDAPAKDDGWKFSTRSPNGYTSGGAQGSFYFQSTPGAAFNSYNGTRGFSDFSLGHALGFAREFGIGDVQATVGARVAEPLVTNGFTPALEDRRYLGVGPRLGLEGSKKLQSSWVVEWQVGAAMLFGDRSLDSSGGVINPVLPNYAGSGSGSVVNVDGLLGLSYWFNEASKLTLGYRADAYFKGSGSLNAVGVPPPNGDHIDHGPMVRFSIQN